MRDVFPIHRGHSVRIGRALFQKDGSLSVLLDGIPVTGRTHVSAAEKGDDDEQSQSPEKG